MSVGTTSSPLNIIIVNTRSYSIMGRGIHSREALGSFSTQACFKGKAKFTDGEAPMLIYAYRGRGKGERDGEREIERHKDREILQCHSTKLELLDALDGTSQCA